ncbi:uncharacterized protein LOC126570274 [Anopheles aquasalis]|uniref:uncharacterized protein LOC126570274 n=1 Tax=Anopheles aquasalis TaxID=42839 RepID=UPI00215A6506|nr:uncharacterized protein LOC126570274 [Anopheles aquasalis]
MKIIVCLLGVALILLVPLARADPGAVGVQDARKARAPASGATGYNTIAPADSETLSKLQNQVAPTVQIPSKPTTTIKAPETASAFHTVSPPSLANPYLRQPSQAVAPGLTQGQYYVAVMPQATGNHMLAPATTPLIMQYINPQGQPTGGLQYIQLLRPVVYPQYSNQQYIHPGYLQQQSHQQQPQSVNPHSAHGLTSSPYTVSPTPSPATTTTQSAFLPFQPAAALQQPSVPQYASALPTTHYGQPQPQYSNGPVGQYSSPVLSYYPHRFLINPSSELNFNTNEYVPSHGDGVYMKGIKSIRA